MEGQLLLCGNGRGAERAIAEHAVEIASRSLTSLVLHLSITFSAIAQVAAQIVARLWYGHHFHSAVYVPETDDVSRGRSAGMLTGGFLRRD